MACENYSPDLMAMGDCRNCGHTARAHSEDRTHKVWLNFYQLDNASCHLTREMADQMALEIVRDNPRIACVQVDAVIGEGLLDEENW